MYRLSYHVFFSYLFGIGLLKNKFLKLYIIAATVDNFSNRGFGRGGGGFNRNRGDGDGGFRGSYGGGGNNY